MLYINRVACHDPFCLFGFNLDSCTVFRQSTVAEASLLLFNDLSRIENDLEMMFPRFFSAGCRIKSLYRSTSAVFLQLFPFPPTSHNAHSRKRKVAGTTGDNIQKQPSGDSRPPDMYMEASAENFRTLRKPISYRAAFAMKLISTGCPPLTVMICVARLS